MDMHTGSTDEYETDEHHFDGEGDSSDDELVVSANNNARVSLVTTKKQKRPLSPKRNDDGAKSDGDNDGLVSKQRSRAAAASRYEDSSSSEEEMTSNNTNNNKRVRRALGRVNDNKTNTKNNTPAGNNNLSASDNNNNSSDDDSDDLGLGLGSSRQRQAASARKRAAMMKMYDDSDDDSDSSDDDSFSAKKRKTSSHLKNKRSVEVAAKKPLKKKAIALDDSSDSDNSDSDCVDVTPTNKSKRSRATRPAAAAAAAAARSSKVAIDCLSSDSDDDLPPTKATKPPPATTTRRTAFKSDNTNDATQQHDPSVRANSNATLEAAKMARAALLQSQVYHAEDVNLPSLPSQVVVPSPKVSSNVNDDDDDVLDLTSSNDVKSYSAPAPVYTGPIITIYLRYRDSSNKESKVGLKIKMDQPLQHLVDQFQKGKITQMKFDGQNVNLTKTPSFYDMDDEDLIDSVVTADSNIRSSASAFSTGLPARREEMIVIHVRGTAGSRNETYQMKKSDPLNKVVNDYCKKNNLGSITLDYNGRKLDASQSCAQLNIANDAHLDAVVVGGPSINLIFRINGKANETEHIAIRMKGTFQQAFETFAQRRNVTVSQCKFVFDGETLRPSTTPEQLDLEGDEIIDVKVTESASSAVPPRAAALTTTQATCRIVAPASAAAAAPPVMITFETNRNQNKNPRQKKWKLLDTSPVTALKTDYSKYYKSKGCKRVKFYFQNQLITNESQSLRDLGIRNGDRVYAMENGKAYKI